ncbi:MAG: phosphatidylglycerol lysyltransferase domain-containing protein [Anaerolineae bacterium]|nr:phosphatidylglycerol lysyltransferase domain-containing protein [Anaerolineae bacterium]MDW8098358.1 phosphatidylglycerol lysyltransferase domain-containing protein [Anaerolineae bacterium]
MPDVSFSSLRRVRSFIAEVRSCTGKRSVQIAALLTGLMGFINVLSSVTPSLADRLELLRRFLPLVVRHGSHFATTIAGFALLLLARGLWRRKHIAWQLTFVTLVVSAFGHLLKGLDYEEATLAIALASWLLVLRRHFHARSDPPSVRQGLHALAAALLFTLVYGMVGFYLLDRHFSVSFSFGTALKQTVTMLIQFYDPGLQPITGFGQYFADSIYMVGATTLGYSLFMMLRPVLVRRPATHQERVRAKAIVKAWGRSSLAHFTLLDDKSYYFSAGGSMIAYVVKGRIALALGDPIGPEPDIAATITGFQAYCAQNDWQPAFYQTMPDYLDLYRAAGLHILCIGYEGIVDLRAFSLEGKAGKTLRSSVNRLSRLGYRAELYEPPLSDDLLRELRKISDEWLTMIKGVEKRFSVGWFEEGYIRNNPVITVCAPDGHICAFANILSAPQRSEITVDLMRRRREAEPGTMDFLFVSLFQWAQERGYMTFSLGLSALSGLGERADDPAIERALHYIYEHINLFYNFKGIHTFKEKFHPRWAPRYLIYPGPTSLPAVALALVRADSGDVSIWEYITRLLH